MDNIIANHFLEFASIILLHIGSAVICGIIASKKNRNKLLWVILGLLFEVISIVVIALMKPIEKEK